MPKVHNQSTIFAGTRGVFTPDPDKFGPLTVEPIFPGSCQARRQGYKWVCKDAFGDIVYVPFRDFSVLDPLTPPTTDVN